MTTGHRPALYMADVVTFTSANQFSVTLCGVCTTMRFGCLFSRMHNIAQSFSLHKSGSRFRPIGNRHKTFHRQLQLGVVSSVFDVHANEKSRRNTSSNNKLDLIGASDRAREAEGWWSGWEAMTIMFDKNWCRRRRCRQIDDFSNIIAYSYSRICGANTTEAEKKMKPFVCAVLNIRIQ